MNAAFEVLKKDELVARFDAVAPTWMAYDAEYGFAVQHLSANEFLLKTAERDPGSLLAAMSNVAACGLSLNPAEKQAYLIPRKGKICFDPSYMGMCKLATDTGSILWVQADTVYSEDTFQLNGPDEKPTHVRDPFKARGEFVGVYCVAKTHNGDYLTTAMGKEDIDKIRGTSEADKKGSFSPWTTWFEEMAKKTVIRRAFKTWPRSDHVDAEARLAEAVHVSNENEHVAPIVTAPDLRDYSQGEKELYDQLIAESDALGMYVFAQTTSPAVLTNLYHSFAKGNKGKYQRVVDELRSKGEGIFTDYLTEYRDALQEQNETAQDDIQREVSAEAWELLRERA